MKTLEGRVAYFFFFVSILTTITGVWFVTRNAGTTIEAYFPGQLLFPFGMLSTIALGSFWDWGMIIACLQFPAYALILTIGMVRDNLSRYFMVLLASHALAVVLCLVLLPRDSGWPFGNEESASRMYLGTAITATRQDLMARNGW